ncbi:MAG: hypothetical protein IIZ02_03515 [Desulfovibrio sp.]|nr:hypothetical protein [Desulfovibrio sp.]
MHIKTQAGRRLAGATLVWLAAIGIACFMGFAEERLVRDVLDQELAAEAARSATGIGAVASMPGWTMDETLARSLVMRVMEDRRLYAVVIRAEDRMLEGQRRKGRALVPWDNEMTEETVQGMSIMRDAEGGDAGTVEVYLPTRLVAVQMAEVRQAVYAGLALWVVFATAALLLFLWYTGDLCLARLVRKASEAQTGDWSLPPRSSDLQEAQGAEGRTALDACSRDTYHDGIKSSDGRRFVADSPDGWTAVAEGFRRAWRDAPDRLAVLFRQNDAGSVAKEALALRAAALSLGAHRLAEQSMLLARALAGAGETTPACALQDCRRELERVLAVLDERLGG